MPSKYTMFYWMMLIIAYSVTVTLPLGKYFVNQICLFVAYYIGVLETEGRLKNDRI